VKTELIEASLHHNPEIPYLLSNLILLGEFLEHKKVNHVKATLDNLHEVYSQKQQRVDSVFVEEVAIGLSTFIEPKYLATHHVIEHHEFPLVITPKHDGQSAIVVRIDGRLNAGRYFNSDWEKRVLGELEHLQIPVVSIWSYDWWRDPKDAAFKLAQAVFAFDKPYEIKAKAEMVEV
jgi:hypothetical protein